MKNNLLNKVGQVKETSPFIVLLCALLLASPLLVNAQDRTIQGTVTSMLDGTPLPGVNVLIKSSTSGTITDVNGNYNINANENEVLVFSFVGFVTEEIAVSEINNSTYNIALAEDIESLGEVVVVGYGSIKKSDITGAVASVTPDELTKIATPDVVQALQGRVAGVQVIANSGEPGAGMKVRIRGLSSINGGSSPLYVVDGFQTGDISYLNPNDIESMEILKDASATAIYGSRGASGVVLITTKSGKVGKPQFTFDAYGGVQQAANTLDLLNASEYATLRLEAYANDGRELDPLNEEFVRLDFAKQGGYEGTDWQNEILNPAPIQNYSLSVSGGSEKVRYSLSGTYFSQDGLVKNSGMDKFFVNLNTDYELADWLTAGVIVNFVNTDKSNYNNDFYSGILPTTVALSPVIPAFDKPMQNFGRDDISYTNNAARVVTESKYDNYILNKLVGNIFLNAEITKGLSFRTQFGVNLDNRKDKIFRPKFFMATDEARDRSELYERRSESFGWISTNYFTYDRSFGNHAITALAGFENQYGRYSDISVTGFDVPANEDQHYIGAANDPNFVVRSGQSENALQSYFGRINYSFMDRYLLTGTVRYDGSSKFTEEYRWGAFPSVTAGWIISEEKFLEGVQPISFLKLRAGWGQVGNQNVGDYRFVTTVDINQLYVLGGQIVQGAAPRTLSNPAIQWETTETMNFGLDAGFFNDKFTLTADYFIKKTRDMLLGVPIPIYVGALSPTVNAGTMENKGLEVSLGYRNHERKLKYEFNLNFDIIENEITSLAGGEPISSGGVGKVGATTRTEEGNEVAYFYGLKTDGIFNTDDELAAYINEEGNPILPNAEVGDVKFLDVNGDGLVDANDRVKLGSATPDFNYGFSANLSYENFDFSFLVTGVQGAEAVNGLAHLLKSSNGLNNSYSSRIDRWTPENPNSSEPRMTFADANRNAETFSDRYVEDASYIRLKTIQLGYNLQLNSVNMKSLRLYVAADNLITLTDYTGFDPEIGDLYQNVFYYGVDQATYPNPQVFRAGLNLKF